MYEFGYYYKHSNVPPKYRGWGVSGTGHLCQSLDHLLSIPQKMSMVHRLEGDIGDLGCGHVDYKKLLDEAKKRNIPRAKTFKQAIKESKKLEQKKLAQKTTNEYTGTTPTTTTAMSTYLILGLVAAAGVGLYFLYFRR